MNKQQELKEELLGEAKIPALSVSWCQKGISQAVAFGNTDTSSPRPVDTSTRFQAASLSKPVSAAIILDLVEQGKWDLDTPLFKYCRSFGPPEIRQDPNYKTLTTRMIIAQCSGLPNWFEKGAEIKFIAKANTRFSYSGVALDFLKEVIEKKMEKDWDSIAQAFFIKAGMKTSTFKQIQSLDVARAHKADGTPLPIAPVDSPEILAGSLLTTAKDYINFLQYCFKNDYLRSTLLTGTKSNLPPPTSSEALEIQWGLGMGVYSDSDSKKTIVFHHGNNTGSVAFCAMDVATGDCVVSFANSENGPSVFQQVAEPIVGDIKPLFQWLSDYFSFKDVTPQAPESTAKITHLIHSMAKETSKKEDQAEEQSTSLRSPTPSPFK